jgi:hypothetical protein
MMNPALPALLLILFASAAADAQTPLPKLSGPVPVTADSFPMGAWNRNQEIVDLPKLGYVEEEFFISGTANIYDWNTDGTLSVKTANAPYTTRILIKRPVDPARFSGTVVVELLESGRGIDRPFIWAISHNHFIERGDAFVGVTHISTAIEGLKKFNPGRYAALSLANPNPTETCGPQNATSNSEDGLQWDIVSQLGAMLKSPNAGSPLGGFGVQRVYATSHSGDLSTYVNAVHNRVKVYDGFVIKTDGDPVAIRRCAAAPASGDPRRITKNVSAPVIRVIPQGDVLATSVSRREDNDDPNDRYRLYEVAGAPHMDPSYYRHLPLVEDQMAAGAPAFLWQWPLAYACSPPINLMEFPVMQHALDSAFSNLDAWVTKGTPPPRADRIGVRDMGTARASFITDANGNAIGGVRSPYLEVPTATYFPNSPGQAICRQLGHKTTFTWSKLEALYGNAKGYTDKVNQSVDRMVKDRWLTETDGKKIKVELLGQ